MYNEKLGKNSNSLPNIVSLSESSVMGSMSADTHEVMQTHTHVCTHTQAPARARAHSKFTPKHKQRSNDEANDATAAEYL